jgi:hypothetical protein
MMRYGSARQSPIYRHDEKETRETNLSGGEEKGERRNEDGGRMTVVFRRPTSIMITITLIAQLTLHRDMLCRRQGRIWKGR